jgi:hypothetical protein
MRPLAGVGMAVAAIVATLVPAVGPAAAQTSTTSTVRVTVTLTSQQTALTQVGRGGAVTYGWNRLTGAAPTPSGRTAVELLGNVDYTNGSGRFFGFLTLRFESASTLGFLVEGRATKRPDGSTRLKATLRVIDGDAAFTGASGAGSFRGFRAAVLGSPITITITARVRLR